MEKRQFYETLSFILRQKRPLTTIAILDVVLSLATGPMGDSNNIRITNSAALKYLFLDIEMWKTSEELQRFYLNQLQDLIINSNFRDENITKLTSLSVFRVMLLALKSRIIFENCIPELMLNMKILLEKRDSNIDIRALSSFMIYLLPKGSFINSANDFSEIMSTELTDIHTSYAKTTRNSLLELILSILNDSNGGKCFAMDLFRTTSSKWISLFWGPRLDQLSAILALKIFCKCQILLNGVQKSIFSDYGVIIGRGLQQYWHVPEIYHTLLYSLVSFDERTPQSESVFSNAELETLIKNQNPRKLSIAPPTNMTISLLLVISQALNASSNDFQCDNLLT